MNCGRPVISKCQLRGDMSLAMKEYITFVFFFFFISLYIFINTSAKQVLLLIRAVLIVHPINLLIVLLNLIFLSSIKENASVFSIMVMLLNNITNKVIPLKHKSTLDNSPPPNYDKESKDECHHVNNNPRYKWYVK